MPRNFHRITSLWVTRHIAAHSELLLIRQYIGEKSSETLQLRQKILDGCEQMIWDFFDAGGQVVIYDANNGTRAKREDLAAKADKANVHG